MWPSTVTIRRRRSVCSPPSLRSRRLPLAFDTLESRSVPAVYNWIGGIVNPTTRHQDWSEPRNWVMLNDDGTSQGNRVPNDTTAAVVVRLGQGEPPPVISS